MELITYTLKPNINTREPLRKIKNITRLREIADQYWQVMEKTTNPDYKRIWRLPSKGLPKKTIVAGKIYDYQSPREYIEGFIEKINRVSGNDLSARVCDGFALFSEWFAEEFGTDKVVFADDNALANQPKVSLFT